MAQKNERLAIKVLLPPCRMSFPWLFKPQDTDGGPRYQLNMLFPPKTDFKKFEDALYDCMEDMFGKDSKKWPRGRNDRGPDQVIRDATEKDYEGYKDGWFFVKAASKDPVGIVDARRDPVVNEREVYGGRWCRCSVTVVAYDNKSKGVGVYLNSIQLLDHDEQFGGRGPAKNDFEDWEGDPLSDDERGTGSGTSVSTSRGRDDDEDDRDRDGRRGPPEGRRSRGDGDTRGQGSRDGERQRDDRYSRDDERRDSRSSRGRDREDEAEDDRRGRDTRDRDRDDRGRDRDDDRGSRRSRDEDDRGSRRGDDDRRGSRDRDDRDRDDDRRGRGSRDEDERPSRGRSRDDDERPSGRGRARDEEWN